MGWTQSTIELYWEEKKVNKVKQAHSKSAHFHNVRMPNCQPKYASRYGISWTKYVAHDETYGH